MFWWTICGDVLTKIKRVDHPNRRFNNFLQDVCWYVVELPLVGHRKSLGFGECTSEILKTYGFMIKKS